MLRNPPPPSAESRARSRLTSRRSLRRPRRVARGGGKRRARGDVLAGLVLQGAGHVPTRGESQARAQAPDTHGALRPAGGAGAAAAGVLRRAARGSMARGAGAHGPPRGSETSARALGKDVRSAGAGWCPGRRRAGRPGALEGALRARSLGTRPWELAPPERSGSTRPRSGGRRRKRRGEAVEGGPPSGNPRETLAEAAEAAAAALYPGGVTGEESFWLVSDDDGRRRPRTAARFDCGRRPRHASSRWNRPGSNRTPTAWTSRVCPARSC